MKNLTNFCKTVETGVDLRLKKVMYIVHVALLQVVIITLQVYLLLYCWKGKIVFESS